MLSKLPGQNLGRAFNSRYAFSFMSNKIKLVTKTGLNWKTQLKPLFGCLSSAFKLPAEYTQQVWATIFVMLGMAIELR